MLRKITGTFITAAAIALLVGAPGSLHAQSAEEQPQGHEHMHGQTQSGEGETSSCCQQMTEKKKAMHADQEKTQAEIDGLLELVQSTTGHAQQAAMADLLTKLVEQRAHMGGMMQMHPEMMKHMKSGDMTDCPMMKKMNAEEITEAQSIEDQDHSQHR